MECIHLCFGPPHHRICHTFCWPLRYPIWPPQPTPDPPPEFDLFGGLTINGGHPEWLADVHALALALHSAQMAKGDVAKTLHEAVGQGIAHVRQRLPAEFALSLHDHAAEAKA